MPARTHPLSPAPSQSPSYPVYTESPLRNVQLQSEVRTLRRRALRSATSDDAGRRKTNSILQSTIYEALGTSEPVDLLPHISKRAAPLHRGRSDRSSDEGLTPLATVDAKTEANPMESAQPLPQPQQRDPSPPLSSEWVLDEVLYATPPGCGNEDAIMARKHTDTHVLQGGMTRIDGDPIEPHARHRDT
jgi:hypothetical protein